jgi:hypothetical protein
MKRTYEAPKLDTFGTIAAITGALGGDPSPDQSEFPQVPADHGSFDVCNNNTQPGVC